MIDVTVSAEAVEEVRPAELPTDALDDQLIGQLVDRVRGHFPNEAAALKCVYMAVMIAFGGRLSVGRR